MATYKVVETWDSPSSIVPLGSTLTLANNAAFQSSAIVNTSGAKLADWLLEFTVDGSVLGASPCVNVYLVPLIPNEDNTAYKCAHEVNPAASAGTAVSGTLTNIGPCSVVGGISGVISNRRPMGFNCDLPERFIIVIENKTGLGISAIKLLMRLKRETITNAI